jgi:hypothetical protein
MAVAVFLTCLGGGTAAAQVIDEPVLPEETRTVVDVKVDKPPKKVRREKKFTPTATPSPSEVHYIIKHEARLWGGGGIYHRVECESTNRWNASNGTYHGLIQTNSAYWNRAWPGTPRRVVIKNTKKKRKPVYTYTTYSDGSVEKEKTGSVKQKIKIAKIGKLPKGASYMHGWAAIRVGQRAVGGQGPTTYWACTHRGSHY